MKTVQSILFFGIYDPNYSRNRVLLRGFRECGYEVAECRVSPREFSGFWKFLKLYQQYRKLPTKNFDHVLVAFSGHTVAWFATLLFGRKIIFDFFLSLYNSEVEDRKLYRAWHPKSLYYWFIDWSALHLAKVILLDTDAHIEFTAKRFGIQKKKFIRVFVGSDDAIVHPVSGSSHEKCIVHFHGTIIPLQGIQYIVEAARLLQSEKEIEFRLYGPHNPWFQEATQLSNVKIYHQFPASSMASVLAKADIVLGIFGGTQKSKLVIPNKVYEGLAAGKAVITGESPAMKELVTDKKEVLFSKMAYPRDLAKKILDLKNDSELRKIISDGGYELFRKKLTPEILVSGLIKDLSKTKNMV